MVPVGRRNLFAEKTRLLISVGGVAFSVLLVLILLGLYQGFGEAAASYVNSIDADLWVSQDGSSDMFHGISLIPNDVREKLKALPDVKDVSRLIGRQVAFKINDTEVHTYIVGYDTAKDVGGPIRIVQGASEPKRGQIIIDRVFARNEGLKIGDKLRIVGRDFEVVGISAEGNMMLYQYSFITQPEAEEVLKMTGFTNFFVVKLKDPAEKDKVIQEISRIPGIQAVSKSEFAKINSAMVNDAFLPIVGVLVIIGFGVGVTVIGLTIYTATVEKSREYGVLKAVGASNWQLYKIIFEQAIISGTLGYVVGAILTWVIVFFAEGRVPSFVASIRPAAMISVFGMSILMSLTASYIPVRRIVGIDPAMVFKG